MVGYGPSTKCQLRRQEDGVPRSTLMVAGLTVKLSHEMMWRFQMNSSRIAQVLLYHQKFCHPKMSLMTKVKVIQTAMTECSSVQDPTMLSDETVIKVLKKCGIEMVAKSDMVIQPQPDKDKWTS